jgi:hypothetical protein
LSLRSKILTMVKKSNTVSIGEAIQEFLMQYKHKGKLQDADIMNAWPKVMGKNIEALTLSVSVKGSKLIVQLKSSVLRSELMMHKSKIVASLNQHLGMEAVKELIIK